MSTDATPTNEKMDAPPLVLAPGVLLNDRWRMDRCLASGGYGDVWSALDTEQGDARVAIKILRNDAGNNDPSALARMRQEAEILVRISHPNIVKVFGLHDSSYGVFLVMEFLNGLAIDQLLQADGPADTERAIPATRQLLSALQIAHDDDILHRDIKPENIIVIRDDAGHEQAKLLDFGIAKAQSPFGGDGNESGVTLVQTRAGGFMGTPRYTAPEQAVGDPIGPSADLFALGLVLAEWLTGRVRMDGERHQDVMTQLLSSDAVDISDTPYRWHRWLGKILDKKPNNRFQSANEALVAFDEWVVSAQERPDFLDDGYFHGGGNTDVSTPSFGTNNAPLELDLDRVRQADRQRMNSPMGFSSHMSTPATPPLGMVAPPNQAAPAPLSPASNSGQFRPRQRPESLQRAGREEDSSRWPEIMFAIAVFILACVVVFWTMKWLDSGIAP